MKVIFVIFICLIAVSVLADDKKIYRYHRAGSCLTKQASENSEDVIQKLLDEGYLLYKKELVYPYKFSVYTIPLIFEPDLWEPGKTSAYAAISPELAFEFILVNPLELIIIERQRDFVYGSVRGVNNALLICNTAYFGRVGFTKESPYYISAVEEELADLFRFHKYFIIHAPLDESELSEVRKEIRVLEKEKCSVAVSKKMVPFFEKNKWLFPSVIYECEAK